MRNSVLVTGGLGFLGSAMVRHLVASGIEPTILDFATYAGDVRRLHEVEGRFALVKRDVADPGIVDDFVEVRPDLVLHFAAETHVTRSESDPDLFFRTNVEGTREVISAADAAGANLVVHVSTDEVYGPCEDRPFKENDKEHGEGRASSAYARSKALADDLAVSMSSRIPVVVVRPTNCFGPWQHPEKAIPRWITRGLRGEPLPVWGDGQQTRDWMFVDDLCTAIEVVCARGEPGQVYNLAPEGGSLSNLEIARRLGRLMGVEDKVYLTQYDRPDHDRRYAVDASALRALGWEPASGIDERLEHTVDWYRRNEQWWRDHLADAERLYDDQRAREVDP